MLIAAALLALESCGSVSAAPTPTIEYRTPVPVGTAVHTLTGVPIPPPCECQNPTETPYVATTTVTPVPVVPPTNAGSPTGQSTGGSSLLPVRPVTGDGDGSGLGAVTPGPGIGSGVGGTGLAYAGQCGWDFDATAITWWGEITRYPWDACTALRIVQRESHGLNVYNYEGSGACGVMQLLPCEYPEDGAANIAFGYWNKYVPALAAWGDGWQPWAVDP